MADEVELPGNDDDDDYEVIPMGPIRRLEKRLKNLEEQKSLSGGENLIHDIMDVMKTNEQLVNTMVESTNELKNSVEDLTHKLDGVADNLNSFMELLEEASEASLQEDVSQGINENVVSPLQSEMQEFKDTNQQVMQNFSDQNQQMMEQMQHMNEKMVEGLSKIGDTLNNLDRRMKRVYAQDKETVFESPSQGRQQSRSSGGGGGRNLGVEGSQQRQGGEQERRDRSQQ